MNCVHPIEKLIKYLNGEISEIDRPTDNDFLNLLENTLDTNILYFPNNGEVCCPNCISDKIRNLIYFYGNISSYENFLSENKSKLNCCSNYIASFNQSNKDERDNMFGGVEKCCNKFTDEYIRNYILKLERLYDNENDTHLTLCNTNPFIYFLNEGIVEFGTINNESALGDILNNVESLGTDSFKFIFLAYILNKGLIIKCGRDLNGNIGTGEQVAFQVVKR